MQGDQRVVRALHWTKSSDSKQCYAVKCSEIAALRAITWPDVSKRADGSVAGVNESHFFQHANCMARMVT